MSDPRTRFANGRIAHRSLRGTVAAPAYGDGTAMAVAAPVVALTARPDSSAPERQCLLGHRVTCLETHQGAAFIRHETMGHVGYVAADALIPWRAPTHRVHVARTLLFDRPDFKCPDPVPISMDSHLTILDEVEGGKYARTDDGRYAIAGHLTPLNQPETDAVSVALRLAGTPYLWGGNSAFGIDCSGLVQIALSACGVPCPGDSDQQQVAFATATGGYQPGDLLFWKGHVAMVIDDTTLIHANAHHMAVVDEGIDAAIMRIKAQGDGPVTGHKRPTP